MLRRLTIRRRCAAILLLLTLGVIISIDNMGFWETLGFYDRETPLIFDLILLFFVTIVVSRTYDRTPKAKVDRLLSRVLQEAGECDAQSVTFVLNDIDRSLYIDIDERVVVFPCYYKLTHQLGNRIVATHNVIPHRLKDGRSYAYFLTPTSAK